MIRAALLLAFACTGSAFAADDPPKEAAKEAPKEAPKEPPKFTFAFHGFIGGSLYGQDAMTGPTAGANAWYSQIPNQGTTVTVPALKWLSTNPTDTFVLGGDVRQTRLNFSIAGPQVLGGATPKGVAEVDFFGGQGPGAYGDISIFPRMRVAYADLSWKDTTIRGGQDYDLLLGINTIGAPASLPVSVGHIANPVTYAAGTVGFRHPGFSIYHRLDLGDDMKLELGLQISRAAWSNAANPGSQTIGTPVTNGVNGTVQSTNQFSNQLVDAGTASGLPAIEARALFTKGKLLELFLAGHWSNVDPSGWGLASNSSLTGAAAPKCRADAPTVGASGVATSTGYAGAGCSDYQVYSANVGVRVAAEGFTFTGHAYMGQNLSPLLGQLVQYTTDYAGDVSEWGGWAQLGYDITPELSVWGLIGTEQLDDAGAKRNSLALLQNTVSQGMIRYMTGGMAIGFEFTHWHTRSRASYNPQLGNTFWDANQGMLSMFYFF
jgi:hypothetical protein